jgi:CubicO group peptidase (beta-lactamase class C family)
VSAVAIVKLVEQGKLGLNDTVASYLPEWGNMEVGVCVH